MVAEVRRDLRHGLGALFLTGEVGRTPQAVLERFGQARIPDGPIVPTIEHAQLGGLICLPQSFVEPRCVGEDPVAIVIARADEDGGGETLAREPR